KHGIPLRVAGKAIGYLFLTGDRMIGPEDELVDQLALAVSNILAREELQSWENERATLLGFSEDVAAVRDKNDLPGMIHAWLKRSFFFSHLEIMLTDPVHRSYRSFISDPRSKARILPEYQRLSSALYSTDDPVMQLVNSSRGPLVLDLALLKEK